ncbi:MAG: HAD family hydrolase [Planctomycetes bacterium]|nr:HAD family hydrolase [Planctomycetota bacterium]
MESPLFSNSGIPLPINPLGIAFDMDGTLLDYDGHLSESVARSVRAIANTGIKVFLVSGRIQSGIEEFWNELGLDTPVGSSNGAMVGIPGQEPIFHMRLSKEARNIVLDLEKKHSLHLHYYIDDRAYTLEDGPDRDWYSRQFTYVEWLDSVEDLLSRRLPTKALCIAPEKDHARVKKLFADALGDLATVTESNERFVEILPVGADKGLAVTTLAEYSNIPIERMVAVGDAMNDQPMLDIAGFAITFKSGNPKLFEHADMILPPLWEDGMNILAKVILGLTDSGRFLTSRSGRFLKD